MCRKTEDKKRAPDGVDTESLTHLPVAEHELGAGQATGALADLVGEAEALGHGQHRVDDEDLRALLHLLAEHAALALGQHAVDAT